MADGRPSCQRLLKGLVGARTYSLRGTLLVLSALSLGFAVWSGATGRIGGALAGVGAFVLLLLLGLVAQQIAERSGAVERDRRRDEELQAEIEAWPRWKRIAFFVVGLLVGIGAIALRLWSDGFRPG